MAHKNAIDGYLELLKEFRERFGTDSYRKKSMEDPEKKNRKIYTVINTVWDLTNDGMYRELSNMAEKLYDTGFYNKAKSEFDTLRIISKVDDAVKRMERLSNINYEDFERFGNFVGFFVHEDNVKMMVEDFQGNERDEDLINVCAFIMACLFFSVFNEKNLNDIYKLASRSSFKLNESSDSDTELSNQPDGKYLASFFCQLGGNYDVEDYEHFMILGENFDDVKKKFVDFIGKAVENMSFEPYESEFSSDVWEEFSRGQFESSFNYFKDRLVQSIKSEKDFDVFFHTRSEIFGSCGIPIHVIERDEFYTESFIGFDKLYYFSDFISHPEPRSFFKGFTVIGDPSLVGKVLGERARIDFNILAASNNILNYKIGTESEIKTVKEKYPEMDKSFRDTIGPELDKKLPGVGRISKNIRGLKDLYESR